jgi:hypothetical protein
MSSKNGFFDKYCDSLYWIERIMRVASSSESSCISSKWKSGVLLRAARADTGAAFQHGVKYDIIPCKAKDFVVQKRRFGLGNLI